MAIVWFTVCSLCILTYCNLVIPHVGFEGETLVLIASVTYLLLFLFSGTVF